MSLVKGILNISDLLGVTKSKGVKRTLACIFLFAAQAPIPALLPFQPVLLQIATALGALGVAHAAIAD